MLKQWLQWPSNSLQMMDNMIPEQSHPVHLQIIFLKSRTTLISFKNDQMKWNLVHSLKFLDLMASLTL